VWSVYQSHLPAQARRIINGETYIFKLDWVPIETEAGLVERCLLCVTDLSEELQFRDRIQKSLDENSRLLTIAQQVTSGNGEMLRQFISEAIDKIPEFVELMQRDGAEIDRVVREVHTFKGAMRMFGFSNLAHGLHIAESALQAEGQRDSSLAGGALEQLLPELSAVKTMLDELSVPGGESKSLNGGSNLLRFVGDQMQVIRETLGQAGARLGAVECQDLVVSWKGKSFEKIAAMVMHAINNSIDHGYLIPASEGNPLRDIELHVKAERRGNKVVVSVSDKGAGMAWERLKVIAEKKGLMEVFKRNPTDILFLDGTTTAIKVTMTSGRGVGLAAIRETAQELGGTAQIVFPETGGAVVSVTLPLEAVCDDKDPSTTLTKAG